MYVYKGMKHIICISFQVRLTTHVKMSLTKHTAINPFYSADKGGNIVIYDADNLAGLPRVRWQACRGP